MLELTVYQANTVSNLDMMQWKKKKKIVANLINIPQLHKLRI